jgi:hypothetical protein
VCCEISVSVNYKTNARSKLRSQGVNGTATYNNLYFIFESTLKTILGLKNYCFRKIIEIG